MKKPKRYVDPPLTKLVISFNRPITEAEQQDIAQYVRVWLDDNDFGDDLFTKWEFK